MTTPRPVGIDDMAAYVPHLYLPIRDLAAERGIEPAKLEKGLGLTSMALPDVGEDTATMAANAVRKLIERNGLQPKDIGRIYLGTESALDGAKPTATYVLEMLRQHYADHFDKADWRHCDVIDMTFACIGGMDALLNTLDWVRADPRRVGIVVASDFAKYALESTGEYTQGAGAVAMLVKADPRLLKIGAAVGVGTRGIHDFFKPVNEVDKYEMVRKVLFSAAYEGSHAHDVLRGVSGGVLDSPDRTLTVHKITPTFDGPYSNWAYQQRIREAYYHYLEQEKTEASPLFDWDRLVLHLPYAGHGRRILMELYVRELERAGKWRTESVKDELPNTPAYTPDSGDAEAEAAWSKYLRAVGKSNGYRAFVQEKLAGTATLSSEVGNVYAGSIFLALMSALQYGGDLSGKTLGLIAYGSGSKSKVVGATVGSDYASLVARWTVTEELERREAVSIADYLAIHKGERCEGLDRTPQGFYLERISTEQNKEGARYYGWLG